MDRRAAGLTANYAAKARNCDSLYCGTQPGQTGPVLRRLQTYGDVVGFCVGKWGELSQSLHDLIHHLAKARLQLRDLQRPLGKRNGKELGDGALMALNTSYLRRSFSFCAVRSQSRLLLDRLEGLIGNEAAIVGRRRQAAAEAEHVASKERHAQATALRQGRVVIRRGHFMAD